MLRIEDFTGHDRKQVQRFKERMDTNKETFADSFKADFSEFQKMHVEGETFVDDLYISFTADIGKSVNKDSNKYEEPTSPQREMVKKYSERVFPNNLEYRDGLLKVIDSREIDRTRCSRLIKNLKAQADEPTPSQRKVLLKYWNHSLYPQTFRRIITSIPNLKNSREAQSEAIGRCKRRESQLYQDHPNYTEEIFRETVQAINRHEGSRIGNQQYDIISIYGLEEVRTWFFRGELSAVLVQASFENKSIEREEQKRKEWLNEVFNDSEKGTPYLSESEYKSIEAEQERKRIASMEAVNEKRRKQGKEPYNKREYNSYVKAMQESTRTEKGFRLQLIEVRIKKRLNSKPTAK